MQEFNTDQTEFVLELITKITESYDRGMKKAGLDETQRSDIREQVQGATAMWFLTQLAPQTTPPA